MCGRHLEPRYKEEKIRVLFMQHPVLTYLPSILSGPMNLSILKSAFYIRAGCTTMTKFKVTILIYQGGVFMGNFMGNNIKQFILITEKL
jgi:hypothetical protein